MIGVGQGHGVRMMVLAQGGLTPDARWDAIQQHWSSNSAQLIPTRWMLGLVVLAVGVLLVWLVVERVRRRYPRVTPLMIFYDLGDELGLSLGDRWLLFRVAHSQRLETPLTLVLSPGTLEHYGERYAQTRWASRRAGVRLRLVEIARTLYM